MVATGLVVDFRSPAEFAPDDNRNVPVKASIVQISNQSRQAGIQSRQVRSAVEKLRDAGRGFDAALREAAEIRLRPILMTSIAFCAGVVPLIVGSGAGSEMRQAMGIAVFSGMLGVTAFGIFLTPVFYVLLRSRRARRLAAAAPAAPAATATASTEGGQHV